MELRQLRALSLFSPWVRHRCSVHQQTSLNLLELSTIPSVPIQWTSRARNSSEIKWSKGHFGSIIQCATKSEDQWSAGHCTKKRRDPCLPQSGCRNVTGQSVLPWNYLIMYFCQENSRHRTLQLPLGVPFYHVISILIDPNLTSWMMSRVSPVELSCKGSEQTIPKTMEAYWPRYTPIAGLCRIESSGEKERNTPL